MECNATNKTKNCNEIFFISVEIILIMTLSLLAGHTFEIVHVRSAYGCSDDVQVIDLGDVISRLIILEEKLQILHVLKLHEL